MRTRTTKFVCDRCESVETTPGSYDSRGGHCDVMPDGWTFYRPKEIDLCTDCNVALIAVREMAEEMIKSWFNERERSKTTT